MKNFKIASSVFNSVSKVYDTFLEKFTFGYIHKWQNKLIEKTTIKKVVLDIGTGTGEILKKISNKKDDFILIGLDVSFNMLLLAKQKVPKANFILADAHNIPVKENSIDNIFFSLTFRHLDYYSLVKNLKKILKTNGEISILEIPKPNKFLYIVILFFMKFLFKPIGNLLFSKDEYNYFIHSIENSLTVSQMEKLFEEEGFKTVYAETKLLGMIVLAVFRKED